MKICVVTGTRAEYGLFYWLLKAFQDEPDITLQLIVTGMHLSAEFGLTYKEIEHDGFVISDSVDILLSGDTPTAISKSAGLALIGLSDSYKRLEPDLIVLLGDRFEALSAAQAAMFANIPIAHIHGGELTEGAIDDAIRHSISKMSHIHFPATEKYRHRLMRLGESPERIFNVGALGVESVSRTQLISRAELERSIDFALGEKFFLVTYHPVTLDANRHLDGLNALLSALDKFPDHKVLITFPNADTHGRELIDRLHRYQQHRQDQVLLIESLGRVRYFTALKFCSCVIGNSSSGLIEAPTFKTPTVNIGLRQKGRLRAKSVIDCIAEESEIYSSIKDALAMVKKSDPKIFENPYDGGETSIEITKILKRQDLKTVIHKTFYTG